jgi:hypothetical protein
MPIQTAEDIPDIAGTHRVAGLGDVANLTLSSPTLDRHARRRPGIHEFPAQPTQDS